MGMGGMHSAYVTVFDHEHNSVIPRARSQAPTTQQSTPDVIARMLLVAVNVSPAEGSRSVDPDRLSCWCIARAMVARAGADALSRCCAGGVAGDGDELDSRANEGVCESGYTLASAVAVGPPSRRWMVDTCVLAASAMRRRGGGDGTGKADLAEEGDEGGKVGSCGGGEGGLHSGSGRGSPNDTSAM